MAIVVDEHLGLLTFLGHGHRLSGTSFICVFFRFLGRHQALWGSCHMSPADAAGVGGVNCRGRHNTVSLPVILIDYSVVAGITYKAGGGILRNSKNLELYLERLTLNYTLCVVLGNLNARWKPSTSAVSCCSLVRDTAIAPANQKPVIQLPGLPRALAISALTLAVTCTLVLPYE